MVWRFSRAGGLTTFWTLNRPEYLKLGDWYWDKALIGEKWILSSGGSVKLRSCFVQASRTHPFLDGFLDRCFVSPGITWLFEPEYRFRCDVVMLAIEEAEAEAVPRRPLVCLGSLLPGL